MKKYLLSLITFSFLLCEASFTGGGMAFATPASLGNGVTWEISGTTLTIGYEGEGSGVMPTYSGSDRPWYSSRTSITNIVVEEGITVIGGYAFNGFSAATTLSLPSTLDSIGLNVFISLNTSCATTFHGTVEQWCNMGLRDYDSNPFYHGDGKFRTDAGIITTINIPQGVTKITPSLFRKTTITKLTIPTSVTVIGAHAFRDCSSLSSVTFTATSKVDSIATYAFANCSALTTLDIPSSVRIIETYAFNGCSALTTIDFNNASKLKTIGNYAFQGTTALTTLSLRGATSLETIGTSAFNLTSASTNAKSYLYLPASLRAIGANAFNNRTGLEGIVIMNTNTTDAKLTKCAGTTCFPAALSGIPVYVYSASVQSAYSGLTEWSTFTNYSTTNTVTFNCGTPTASSLVASLDIRSGTLSFTGSGDMKDYTSTKADWKMDVYKSVLKSVSITKMSRIGAYAFYNCDNLTGSISIPNTVVSIGNRAFYGCKGLTGLTLSSASKLETIDQYAFYNCSKITSSYSATTWGGKVSTIGQHAFDGCGLTSVALPSTLTSLGNYAFQNNKSLTKMDFSAATSLTTFGTYVFSGCSALSNVTLQSTLTALPARTFSSCSSLKTVSLPASIASVDNTAFASSGIKTIIANRSTTPTLSSAMSYISPDTVRLAVFTSAAKTAYKAHSYWGQFNVDTKIEGECGAEGGNVTYEFDLATGVLTLTGSGATATYSTSDANRAPWYAYRSLINSAVVGNGITGIGSYAFKECASMTTVSLPASLTTMGSSVFDGCTGLASYTYAGTIEQWLGITFSGTSSTPMYYVKKLYANGSDTEITNLVIPDGVTSIPNYAFYNCQGLVSVTLPASLTAVGSSAFSTCTHIENTNYLGTIDQWCGITFAGNVSNPAYFSQQLSIDGVEQTDIYLSDELAEIKNYTFYSNAALTSISLKNTTTIQSNALTNCNADLIVRGELTGTCGTGLNWSLLDGVLTISKESGTGAMTNYSDKGAPWYPYRKPISKIIVEEGVTQVGKYAFQDIPGTLCAYLPSTLTKLEDYAFKNSSNLAYVVSKATTPPSIPAHQSGSSSYESGTFASVATDIPVYVPSGSESAYASAMTITYSTSTGWKRFSNIWAYTGTCGATGNEANVTWTYNPEDNSLTISGTGAMADFANSTSMPWNNFKTSIMSAVFESGVTNIGQYSFHGCTNLASLTIPSSVTSFKTLTYNNCNNLTTVNYLGTANQWASCTFASGTANPMYASKSLQLNGVTLTTCTLSVPVKDYAFYEDNDLQTLVLAAGCTSVGEQSFYYCQNLKDVTISSDVTEFKSSAFSLCSALDKANEGSVNYLGTANQWASITFASSNSNPVYNAKSLKLNGTTLTNCTVSVPVKEYALYCEKDLESLTLDEGATSIASNAFYGCSALQTISCAASANLASIGSSAFSGCSALADITLPASLQEVGSSAFNSCSALDADASVNFLGTLNQWASITFASKSCNPASLVHKLKINGDVVGACTLSVPVKAYTFADNTSLTSLTLGAGCTNIGASAFEGCSNLGGTIAFPSTITEVASQAFRSCTSISGLDFSQASSLTTLGSSAFYGCTSIAGELHFPASLSSIGGNVFQNIAGITAIYEARTEAPTGLNSYTFNSIDKSIPFYVTSATAASNYAAAPYWQDFTNVSYYGYCGTTGHEEEVTWIFDSSDNSITISGTGAMADYANSTAMPWNDFKTSITSLVIEDGVTTIGTRAFYGCSSLASIIFPETFSSIGNYAFYNNTALTSVALPEGITDVGNSLFYGCTHLASVTLPSTLLSIGSSAFHSNAFTSISIPSSVSTISSYAFKNCTNLESIVVPNITILNEETFYGCSSLGSVTLPNSLTSIKKNTFVNCSSLTSITIPENVVEIVCVQGSGSATCPFSGCTSLTSVVWNARACGGFSRVGQYQEYAMPFESIKENIESFTFGANVTSIPSYVCHGMTGLTDITIPASVTTIGANAFEGCTNIATVTSNAASVPSIASSTFPTAVESAATLYVPATVAVRTAYSGDTYWSEFDHILPYLLSFNMNGHGETIDPICVNAGRVDEALKPANPVDADYHSFSGWYQEAGCSTPFTFGESGTVVNADKTIYAKWTIYNYQVTFDMQGHGASIAAQTIDHNGLVSQPSTPSETGYTFGGWYKEAGCSNAWDFSNDHITAATTLYAKWTINSYDVTFDLQGHGDAIDAQSVNYNGLVSEPTDPSAEGFTFGGWFKEAGCSNAWDFSNDHITAATTLYAKWTENVYTFADTDTDNSKIAAAEGKLASSITIGRTIWKDGYYNSLCLPFDLSAEQIAASPLAGYKALKRLSAAAVTGEGEERVLNIQLEPISEINAGEPCFISYEVGENIVNPEFNNVTVTASEPGSIVKGDLTCNGLYASSNLGTTTTNLFVGENNTLYWPAEGKSTIKGLRAYFSISPSSPAVARGMRVRFVDRMPTGIEEAITNDQSPITNKIIREGQLFILRDGKTYNAQGALIK